MTEPARLLPQDYDSHTVVGAMDEALARVEAATLAVSSIEGRIRSNKILQRALKAWKVGRKGLNDAEDEGHFQEFAAPLAVILETWQCVGGSDHPAPPSANA